MRRHRAIRLSLALAVLLAASLSACGDAGATAASATATSTAAATPSASHAGPVAVAALGGPVDAFSAQYGTKSNNLFNANGVLFRIDDDTGSDGKARVFAMLAYPSDTSLWTMKQAKLVCTGFLPPDATFGRSIIAGDGSPEDVYTSAQARASFEPSSSRYSADGSINIRYERPRDGGSGVFQCNLSLGV